MVFKKRERTEEGAICSTAGKDTCSSLEFFSAGHMSAGDDGLQSNEAAQLPKRSLSKAILLCSLILLLGIAASASFIAIGIMSSNRLQDDLFDRYATEITSVIETSWHSYEVAGLFVHEVGRNRSQNNSRKEFRELYEYLVSTGLVFQAISFNPNTTHAERSELEEESRSFYAENYPDLVTNYQGIVGLEPNDPTNSSAGMSVVSRSEQPFYFPVHLIEPVEGNVVAIDFDLYSSASRRETIHRALGVWKPALTSRLSLVQEIDESAFSVILMHPGVPLSTEPDLQPRDFSSIVIRIPDLLRASIESRCHSTIVYIFDSTDEVGPAQFLGGASLANSNELVYERETTLEALRAKSTKIAEKVVPIASSEWTVVVLATPGSYLAENTFIILGGCIIFTGCTLLAVWLWTFMKNQRNQALKDREVEAEKVALIVEGAKKAARNEREMNDFLAHEVRNPLSAAMSACSFVTSALTKEIQPLKTNCESKKNLESALEDSNIISSSLQFINELLRNMLDMQRASCNQLTIEMSPTDVWQDVFVPIDAMLYRRGSLFEVQTDCPDNLFVLTDRLRLKQIVLNLARNSVKFVEKGYIRLRADVIDEKVHVFIEDSGPGIPYGKQQKLFAKFQESLDSLHQGTGIGLSLCRNLVDLMGAEIWYDGSFNSGVAGCPGTRFVINLNVPPLQIDDDMTDARIEEKRVGTDTIDAHGDIENALNEVAETDPAAYNQALSEDFFPEKLNVLFVDDDMVLRKLFCRAVRKVAPEWSISEAANGESVLRLLEGSEEDIQRFDLIFLDQYMTSVEKQLLGTETATAIRAKGVRSTICGLSANDNEEAFLRAGANAFMMKPFPCEKNALMKELMRVIRSGKQSSHHDSISNML